MNQYIDIVFDGPPGPQAGRFVEVEDANGKGFSFGKWVQREDGYWALRIPPMDALLEAAENLENDDGSIPEHAWKPLQDAIRKVREI